MQAGERAEANTAKTFKMHLLKSFVGLNNEQAHQTFGVIKFGVGGFVAAFPQKGRDEGGLG